MELLADRDPEEARKIPDPVLEHMMDMRFWREQAEAETRQRLTAYRGPIPGP